MCYKFVIATIKCEKESNTWKINDSHFSTFSRWEHATNNYDFKSLFMRLFSHFLMSARYYKINITYELKIITINRKMLRVKHIFKIIKKKNCGLKTPTNFRTYKCEMFFFFFLSNTTRGIQRTCLKHVKHYFKQFCLTNAIILRECRMRLYLKRDRDKLVRDQGKLEGWLFDSN